MDHRKSPPNGLRRDAAMAGAALLAVAAAGCGPTATQADPDPPRPKAAAASTPPAKGTGEVAELSAGGAAFGVELYNRLRQEPGNVFLSPTSISTAFGMAYAGARGATADEIAKTLHFDAAQDRFHPAMGAMLKQAQTDLPGVKLTIANTLWAQDGLPLVDGFTRVADAHYRGSVRRVNFLQPAKAGGTINAWVEERTNARIKQLVRPENLDPSTRLILTNAIWFKGDWQDEFEKTATRQEPFRLAGGGSRTTPLMHRTGEYRHLDGGDFQALELPYKGGALSMVVLLPKAVDGLPALEAKLTPESMAGWTRALMARAPEQANVTLPKFKMETRYLLKPELQALGMQNAFGPQADFSGITGDRSLLIDQVIHQTFVAVDEVGTEAAAATAVIMAESSAPRMVEFRADHPFLFAIRDNRSGALHFLGRLAEPAG
jgi:serpin B